MQLAVSLSLSWRHRSLFKGAELFTLTTYAGLEQQISGNVNVSTRRTGIEANLYVPRIITPIHFRTNSSYVPQTKFTAAYELFNRTSQYLLTSIRGSYGYVWKENVKSEHQLNMININSVQPANITDSFKLVLENNVQLRRSIERQFIIGSNYNYSYNTLNKPSNINRKHNFYFNANIDLSGNLLGLVTGANYKNGKEKTIFNTPFSQYTRVEMELRHRLRLGEFSSFHIAAVGRRSFCLWQQSFRAFYKRIFCRRYQRPQGFPLAKLRSWQLLCRQSTRYLYCRPARRHKAGDECRVPC